VKETESGKRTAEDISDAGYFSAFSFYFNLVIACLLGLSLFKCGDRLGIEVD